MANASFAAAFNYVGWHWATYIVALGALMGIVTTTLVSVLHLRASTCFTLTSWHLWTMTAISSHPCSYAHGACAHTLSRSQHTIAIAQIGMYGASRIITGVARDHLIPPFLARVNARFQTPWVSGATWLWRLGPALGLCLQQGTRNCSWKVPPRLAAPAAYFSCLVNAHSTACCACVNIHPQTRMHTQVAILIQGAASAILALLSPFSELADMVSISTLFAFWVGGCVCSSVLVM